MVADVDLNIPVLLRRFPSGDDDPRIQPIPEAGWAPGERRRYGIQFRHSLRNEERQEIQVSLGLLLDAYVPRFAYVELVREETLQALIGHALVNGVFPIVPDYKVAPGMGDVPHTGGLRRRPAPSLLLRAVLFPEAHVPSVVSELTQLDVVDVLVLDARGRKGAARLEFNLLRPSQVSDIARIAEISWVEEVTDVSPDATAEMTWLESGNAHELPITGSGLCGSNQVVGVIDGGALIFENCWFRDNTDNAPRRDHRKVVNYRNTSGEGLPLHPTFVCGILAGDDVDNPGTNPNRGFACDARITYRNRWDIDLSGPDTTLYDVLVEAVADDARVHNLSWHFGDNPDYSLIAYDVDKFSWEFEDCLVVAASGNRGDRRGPPGAAKNSLCVSAAYVGPPDTNGDGDGDGHGAVVSCLGDGISGPTNPDLRRKPDILAPGCGHVSAHDGLECGPQGAREANALPPLPTSCVPNDVYCAASYATPVVSASAAIARQYFLEGRHPSGAHEPSGALLKAVLLNATAATTSGLGYPNDVEGWGLLQLDRALPLVDGARKLWFADIPHVDGLTTGMVHDHHVVEVNSGAKPLKVTLVWTDYPGQTYSYKEPTVNNLDLQVIAPDETTFYLGNHVAGGVWVAGGTLEENADRLNNVEMVLVANPGPGSWRIAVHGTGVNVYTTGQGYALVISGDLA